MKKLITALFMNRWIPTVTVIFIILCIASLFIPTLPFKWWYAIVWVFMRLMFVLVLIRWIENDSGYYDWLYSNSNDKNRKHLIELKTLIDKSQ